MGHLELAIWPGVLRLVGVWGVRGQGRGVQLVAWAGLLAIRDVGDLAAGGIRVLLAAFAGVPVLERGPEFPVLVWRGRVGLQQGVVGTTK